MHLNVSNIKHSIYDLAGMIPANVVWIETIDLSIRILGVLISLGFLILRWNWQRKEDKKRRSGDNYDNRKN
jgi:hypothetical protein